MSRYFYRIFPLVPFDWRARCNDTVNNEYHTLWNCTGVDSSDHHFASCLCRIPCLMSLLSPIFLVGGVNPSWFGTLLCRGCCLSASRWWRYKEKTGRFIGWPLKNCEMPLILCKRWHQITTVENWKQWWIGNFRILKWQKRENPERKIRPFISAVGPRFARFGSLCALYNGVVFQDVNFLAASEEKLMTFRLTFPPCYFLKAVLLYVNAGDFKPHAAKLQWMLVGQPHPRCCNLQLRRYNPSWLWSRRFIFLCIRAIFRARF